MEFHGQVQGVGFQWRARMSAQELGLTGWVQNLWNGSVLMEIQGEDFQINRMLAQIDRGSFIHIEELIKTDVPVDEEEMGFRVRGY